MPVGALTAGLKPEERRFIQANPVDVEDWGTLTLTFSDGTKATILACDMILGGVLALAVIVDSLARRSRRSHGRA